MKKIPLWIWGAGALGALWYLSKPNVSGVSGSAPAGQSVAGGAQVGAGRIHGGGGGGHHHHGGGVPWGRGFAGVDYVTYVPSCDCDDLPALQQWCTRRPGRVT